MTTATQSNAPGRTETARARLLVISTDAGLTRNIAPELERRGYEVSLAESGHRARTLVNEAEPDLIVLDLILEDTDGLVLLSELKAHRSTATIIVSHTQRKGDVLLGFRLGADDFVARPVDVDELEARLQAILRRTRSSQPAPAPSAPEARPTRPGGPVTFRDLTIDPVRARVTLAGRPVHLTPIEFRLLAALAESPDGMLPKHELVERVWGRDIGGSRAIDVHMGRLRQKLRRAHPSAPTIGSVRVQAYRLGAPDAEDAS